MKTKAELIEFLNKCNKVSSFGMSKGPCPFDDKGKLGCCAECSTPATINWVLGKERNAHHNKQHKMIKVLKGV